MRVGSENIYALNRGFSHFIGLPAIFKHWDFLTIWPLEAYCSGWNFEIFGVLDIALDEIFRRTTYLKKRKNEVSKKVYQPGLGESVSSLRTWSWTRQYSIYLVVRLWKIIGGSATSVSGAFAIITYLAAVVSLCSVNKGRR